MHLTFGIKNLMFIEKMLYLCCDELFAYYNKSSDAYVQRSHQNSKNNFTFNIKTKLLCLNEKLRFLFTKLTFGFCFVHSITSILLEKHFE
jgi:hypothetical protein